MSKFEQVKAELLKEENRNKCMVTQQKKLNTLPIESLEDKFNKLCKVAITRNQQHTSE